MPTVIGGCANSTRFVTLDSDLRRRRRRGGDKICIGSGIYLLYPGRLKEALVYSEGKCFREVKQEVNFTSVLRRKCLVFALLCWYRG